MKKFAEVLFGSSRSISLDVPSFSIFILKLFLIFQTNASLQTSMRSATATAASAPQFVMTGDVITGEPGFLTGHGTQSTDEKKLVSTVAGFVERTNKLISVRPLNARCLELKFFISSQNRCRYQAEVGDVLVGRITEVCALWHENLIVLCTAG